MIIPVTAPHLLKELEWIWRNSSEKTEMPIQEM